MTPETPAQRMIAKRGIPIGLSLAFVFGAIGLLLDSTLAGILAGIGVMMMILGYRYRQSG
ncbi:MAG TPA: hypothetical protein VF662_01880 [Allosphingosinicella sp.]